MGAQTDLMMTRGGNPGSPLTPQLPGFSQPAAINPDSCNYTVTVFTLPDKSVRQIVPQNPNRKGLIVSLTNGTKMGILLQSSDPNGTDYTSQPTVLQSLVLSAISIDTTVSQNGIDFEHTPTNAVSIVNNSGGAITGIVCEGT